MNWNLPPWIVEDKTRDNTRSIFAGRAPFVATNANDDHGEDGRQDYAVEMVVPQLVLADGAGGILAIGLTEAFSGE